MQAIQYDTFDPVLLSLEENAFLVEHAGKAPAVVLRIPFPPGVNPKAVIPVIERVYALEEIEKHDKEPWAGVAALKAQCQTYLDQRASWARMRTRAGEQFPALPTMATWDGRGQPHMGAAGSDSGRVRTYFDADKTRVPFALHLHDRDPTFIPPWVKADKEYEALIIDDSQGVIACPICKHTESYEVASQSAHNMARGRMAKHLASAKKEPDAHKALHTKVFG